MSPLTEGACAAPANGSMAWHTAPRFVTRQSPTPLAPYCRGKLIYVDKEFKQDYTCSPPCRYACQDFSVSRTPFLLRAAPQPAGMPRCSALLWASHTACLRESVCTARPLQPFLGWGAALRRPSILTECAAGRTRCNGAHTLWCNNWQASVSHQSRNLLLHCAQQATPKLELWKDSTENYIMLIERGPSACSPTHCPAAGSPPFPASRPAAVSAQAAWLS